MFRHFKVQLGRQWLATVVSGKRPLTTQLLLNLSACDLVTPLLSIPFDLVLEERGYVWLYDAFMCRVLWPASMLTATASALTLAAISLDR